MNGLMSRLLAGPAGLGTSTIRLAGALGEKRPVSTTIPPLYCPDAVRDNPALGAEVNDRLVEWAAEIGIYEGRLEELRSHNFGRLMMLAHPDCDDPDQENDVLHLTELADQQPNPVKKIMSAAGNAKQTWQLCH